MHVSAGPPRAPQRRRTRAVARLELDELSRKRQRIASAKAAKEAALHADAAAAVAAASSADETGDEEPEEKQLAPASPPPRRAAHDEQKEQDGALPPAPPSAVATRTRAGRGVKRRQPLASADYSWASHSSPPPVPTRRGSSTPVKVGAAFGDNLPVETTPTKAARAPSLLARMEPTPEKNAAPTPPGVLEPADELDDAARASRKAAVARGIAQSGSSSAARKRMISFSPERSPRPENRALALRKLEKNLKTNEKLQMRLEGTPVKTPARATGRALTSPSPGSVNVRRAMSMMSPTTVGSQAASRRASPAKSPGTAGSTSMPISQTIELTYEPLSQQQEHGRENIADAPMTGFASSTSAQKDDAAARVLRREPDTDAEGLPASQTGMASAEVALSQESVDSSVAASDTRDAARDGVDAKSASNYSERAVESEHELPLSQSEPVGAALAAATATATATETAGSVAWAENADAFTSTSVIEDVGLFNCETDVEYTGGVYGEGTDGKVCAAVIGGQKVALKRAKPHEGFPEEEAKRRSAVELHYLRRVRHMKGFLQCLGLCDGIEHTCIALEVMDCKLSDYLRNYGTASAMLTDVSTMSTASLTAVGAAGAGASSTSSKKRRRFTLSVEDTRAMLRQICLPMITLHDHVNVAHGDLACRNILLRTPPKGYEKSFAPEVKLSDFGRVKLPASEPKILDAGFSFFKNCDVGSFGREILYRLLVGEIVPPGCLETRSLHKHLTDVVVTSVPDAARQRLGPFYRLFMRCTGWGVRPSFREILDHLDDLEHFEAADNGLFPLKPSGGASSSCEAAAPGFTSPVAVGRLTSTSASKKSRALETTPHARHGAGKAVNWLKTRSVRVLSAPSASGAALTQSLTPSAGRQQPLLHKKRKTPPSATGTSRRALQIVNQIRSMGADAADKKARKSM